MVLLMQKSVHLFQQGRCRTTNCTELARCECLYDKTERPGRIPLPGFG